MRLLKRRFGALEIGRCKGAEGEDGDKQEDINREALVFHDRRRRQSQSVRS